MANGLNRGLRIAAVLAACLAIGAPATATLSAPVQGADAQAIVFADGGTQVDKNRTAGWLLAEHRRMDAALAGLTGQKPGTIDAYVLVVALDSDPVFGREAREAAKVLARRYGVEPGHLLLLAAPAPGVADEHPMGTPGNIGTALAAIAEKMDVKEDVLVLYTTSHGSPAGIAYRNNDDGYGMISPFRLYQMLGETGIQRRMLVISACYSGVFVPVLQSPSTVIATAASSEHSSFGCQSDNDWTFFGDALVNHALRKPQPFDKAFAEANAMIGGWEKTAKLTPSEPQISIGAETKGWLAALDARMPKDADVPVGKPAMALFAAGGGQ